MRLTVFGASGGVGREVIRQAKGAQHEVTAVVRDLSRAPDGVTAIRADLASDDVTAVADAVARSDEIISCLGASSKSDIGVAAEATRAVVKAMAASDVHRIIAISAAPVARLRAARAGPPQPSTGDECSPAWSSIP
jgi:putative NADH-flavin reductase